MRVKMVFHALVHCVPSKFILLTLNLNIYKVQKCVCVGLWRDFFCPVQGPHKKDPHCECSEKTYIF